MSSACRASAPTWKQGYLGEWLVKPGDPVKRGDIIAIVETQKGVFDVEIFESGVVAQLLVQPGIEVPVGTVLATIAPEGAAPPSAELPPAAAVSIPPPAAAGSADTTGSADACALGSRGAAGGGLTLGAQAGR